MNGTGRMDDSFHRNTRHVVPTTGLPEGSPYGCGGPLFNLDEAPQGMKTALNH